MKLLDEKGLKDLVMESIVDFRPWSLIPSGTRAANISRPVDDGNEVTYKHLHCPEDFPFVIVYLNNLIIDGNKKMFRKEIFDYVLTLLTTIKNSNKSPHVTKTVLLSLLHILKELIIHCPLADKSYVEKFAAVIRSFYTWPNPCGSEAAHVLKILNDEIKAPGATLRERLLVENPLLSAVGELLIENNEEYSMDIIRYSYLQKCVMVYHGDTCNDSKVYRTLFPSHNHLKASETGEYSIPVEDMEVYLNELQSLRIQILYNIFEVDLTLNPDGLPDDEALALEDHDSNGTD